MNYQCTITGGGGAKYKSGIWQKKETPKTILFTLIDEPFWEPNYKTLKINKDIKKNKQHCFRDWQDGTYTVYPDQCGTPYYFEPIKI